MSILYTLYSIKSIFELILLIILLNFRIRKLARYPEDIFFFNKTFIECHRGINKGISQNTLQAFSKAIDYNFQSIEADVWLTKDNVSIIIFIIFLNFFIIIMIKRRNCYLIEIIIFFN